MLNVETVMELLGSVGKLALEEGEAWRLDHAELMDAYNDCLEELESVTHNDQQSLKSRGRDDGDAPQAQSGEL